MSTRQILGRNSYILASALVLMLAAYFVARLGSWEAWLAWIVAVVLLYAGFLALRPGAGTKLGEPELEQLIGSGRPVVLELFSNY
jgi:hypothetical protein